MESGIADITQLLVVILGLVTSLLMGGLKLVVAQMEKMPKATKAMIVAAIAVPIGLLGGFMGMELPGDVTTWDGNTVNVVLTWLTAMGSRAAIKTLKPKP